MKQEEKDVKCMKTVRELVERNEQVIKEVAELERRCERLLEPRELIFGNRRILAQGMVTDDYHYSDPVVKVYLKTGEFEGDEIFELDKSEAILVFQMPEEIDDFIRRLEDVKNFWLEEKSNYSMDSWKDRL